MVVIILLIIQDQSNSMFNNVCRICLQDGDLMSVYDKSIDSEFSYAEKIVQVVNSINLVS